MKKLAFAVLSLFCLATSPIAADGTTLDIGRADLEQAMRAVPQDGSLVLTGVSLGSGSLHLDRFEVFEKNAQIVIHGAAGDTVLQPPDNRYFKGYVTGIPGSRVVLSVTAGGIRGLASSGGKYWLLGRGSAAKAPVVGMTVVEVDPALAGPGFTCASNQLADLSAPLISPSMAARHSTFPEGSTTYGARIAVETDQEFLALFGGNTSAATDYVADLIAHNSAIYADEVDTAMTVSHLSLWTGPDPWNQTSTICGLFEFGRYWNDNNSGVERTIAHFMSGKNNGGGVAWVGVLCSSGFNTDITGAGCSLSPAVDNYGGAYGYSGDMDGNFDIDNPSVVWDMVVTSHEMGHNFNSPHTHCYENVGGNSNAVDNCYAGQCGGSGCYCGSTSLPSGCPGSGNGCGTIMSYCHLLSGGLGNISLTFGNPGGVPFDYGIAPERVPTRMNNHVVSTAAGNPVCLAPIEDNSIFADGFESGDVSSWNSAVP